MSEDVSTGQAHTHAQMDRHVENMMHPAALAVSVSSEHVCFSFFSYLSLRFVIFGFVR